MSPVDFVVPESVADPDWPSGGNRYDRQLAALLDVRLHLASTNSLGRVLDDLADGARVLVDGLLASTAPERVVPLAARTDLLVVLHMPVFDGREARVLRAARGVITTSAWTRDEVVRRYRLDPRTVHVARPGVEAADLTVPSADGSRLLCVGVIAAHKGQDVLADALERVADLTWTCTVVGATRDQVVADRLRGAATLTGPLTGPDLQARYAEADLLVVPSRGETYAMVVTEALARGLPVVASDVGGVAEALGTTRAGRPGLLVPVGDAVALARALRGWLTRADLRAELRRAALVRRDSLAPWSETALLISAAITG